MQGEYIEERRICTEEILAAEQRMIKQKEIVDKERKQKTKRKNESIREKKQKTKR